MKLAVVQVREKVPTGAVGDFTNRLDEARGWVLECDYDKRVIFATKGDTRLVIPLENAPYMVPSIPQAKAAKADPKAAA